MRVVSTSVMYKPRDIHRTLLRSAVFLLVSRLLNGYIRLIATFVLPSASKPKEKDGKEWKGGKGGKSGDKGKGKGSKGPGTGQLTGYRHSQQNPVWKVMQLSARAPCREGVWWCLTWEIAASTLKVMVQVNASSWFVQSFNHNYYMCKMAKSHSCGISAQAHTHTHT